MRHILSHYNYIIISMISMRAVEGRKIVKAEKNSQNEDTGTGRWLDAPPTKCDICDQIIEDEFVDGETNTTMWAIMCPVCHEEQGKGIGPGIGQRYRKDGDKWPKAED